MAPKSINLERFFDRVLTDPYRGAIGQFAYSVKRTPYKKITSRKWSVTSLYRSIIKALVKLHIDRAGWIVTDRRSDALHKLAYRPGGPKGTRFRQICGSCAVLALSIRGPISWIHGQVREIPLTDTLDPEDLHLAGR